MLENFTYNFDSDLILSVSFILCKILSKAKSKHFQSFLLIPKSFTKSTTNLHFTTSCRSKKRAWFLQPHLLGMNLGANCNVMRILKCDVDGNRTRNLAILNSFAKKVQRKRSESSEKKSGSQQKTWTKDFLKHCCYTTEEVLHKKKFSEFLGEHL